MALFIDDTNRLIIPSWRQLDKSQGELRPAGANGIEVKKRDIQEYLLEWKANKNLVTAGELISAAIVNRMPEETAVLEAARFVVNYPLKAPAALRNASKGLLDIPLDQDFFFPANLRLYDKISKLKKLLNNYPSSAILHIEIARLYLLIGQLEIAEYHVHFALYIDPNNRFVVRSAARFYIHIDQKNKAIDVLRKSCLIKKDPWLMASEISVSRHFDKRSPNLKRAGEMIDSRNYSNSDLSELCGTMGMEELENAGYNKSRKLFNQSLTAPNDNSFAQAQWVAKNRHLDLIFPNQSIDVNFKEALCCESFFVGDYKAAIRYAQDWQDEMPYSQKCAVFGSNISTTFEKDYKTSIRLLKTYLQTNRRNKAVLNDLAYVYALDDDTESAQKQVDKAMKAVDMKTLEPADICLVATQGLIYFREKAVEEGSEFYEAAIQACERMRRLDMLYSAKLNYARELLRYKNDEESREKVVKLISDVPEAEKGTERYEQLKDVKKMLKEGAQQ